MIAGHIKWTDYRTGPKPAIWIEHTRAGPQSTIPWKTNCPPERSSNFKEAEAVLAKLTRRGVPMILREIVPKRRGPDEGKKTVFKPYSFSGMQKIGRRGQFMAICMGLCLIAALLFALLR
ncbi:hypothetical protein JQ562_38405 [Bradyrhizobium sp. AUGA SZCCT0051]|nr:hypothetical protein [Bradyrhizobium sp. AUGA SZCCT0051]